MANMQDPLTVLIYGLLYIDVKDRVRNKNMYENLNIGMEVAVDSDIPIIIGSTPVLKESDDLVILEVTFDCKMSFEKHLCLVSRAASQRLGILNKSW